jgi:acetyl esterase/lipase
VGARGLYVETVRADRVRGEWLHPKREEAGVTMYIHGGGFVSCSPRTHRPITGALARLSRCPVFSLDYRLAPEHRWPAALEDGLAAYRWLLDRASAAQIALAGDSAGGGLVLGILLAARAAGLPQPSCAVCFSPWADLSGVGASVRQNDGRCAMFRAENIRDFAHACLAADPGTVPEASPVNSDLGGLAPLLLQVDSSELLLDDARRIHERTSSAGGQSRLQVFEGLFHCWQMGDGIVPEARRALQEAAAFMAAHRAGQTVAPA